MRRKCPPALKKYGWCGVLALLYATNLPMPTTELQFAKCLASLKKILGANMPENDELVTLPRCPHALERASPDPHTAARSSGLSAPGPVGVDWHSKR